MLPPRGPESRLTLGFFLLMNDLFKIRTTSSLDGNVSMVYISDLDNEERIKTQISILVDPNETNDIAYYKSYIQNQI